MTLLKYKVKISLILFIIVLFIRFVIFFLIIPQKALGFEEIQTGIDAYNWAKYGILDSGEHLITNFFAGVLMRFNNFSVTGMRLPFVFLQSLTTPFLYFTLLELTNPFTALLTALLFSFNRFNLFGSFFADELFVGNIIQIPLLYFAVLAYKKEKIIYYLLSGLLLGLLILEYIVYRSALIFIPVLLFYKPAVKLIRNFSPGNLIKIGKKYISRLTVFFIFFILGGFPILNGLIHGNDTLWEGFRRYANGRAGTDYKSLGELFKTNFWSVFPDKTQLVHNLKDIIPTFFFHSNFFEYGASLPMFDFITSALLILGILFCFIKPRKIHLFFLSWFAFCFYIIAIYPPEFEIRRFAALLPQIFILIALGIQRLLKLKYHILRINEFLRQVFVIMIITISLLSNLYILIKVQPKQASYKLIFNLNEAGEICHDKTHPWPCLILK